MIWIHPSHFLLSVRRPDALCDRDDGSPRFPDSSFAAGPLQRDLAPAGSRSYRVSGCAAVWILLVGLTVPLTAKKHGAESGSTSKPVVPASVKFLSDVEYGRDGTAPLLMDLALPKADGLDRLPAVIFIHGGGWANGTKEVDRAADKLFLLVEGGFVAASINYRLSGEAPFPAAIEDCKCAVRFLRTHAEEYRIDPERIGVWGTSAGGHLAMLLGASDPGLWSGDGGWQDQSSRVQAVCSWFGPSDLTQPNLTSSPIF